MNSALTRSLILLILVGGTVVACFLSPKLSTSAKAGVSMQLPDSIQEFEGKTLEVSEGERVLLPPDTEFAKMQYSDGAGNSLSAQIVLAGAEKRSIHRPEVCLPGQGWTIKSAESLEIPLDGGRMLSTTLLRIGRQVDTGQGLRELDSLFVYWFVGHNTTTASHFTRVLKTNLDVLLHNENHRWAYIIVSAPVLEGFKPNGKNSEQTLQMLTEFIQSLAPQIMDPGALPGPKDA